MSPEKAEHDEEPRSRRPLGHFSRPYYEYKSAMCGAQVDAARRQGEANARFAEASQRAEKTAFKPAQDAYDHYQRVYRRLQTSAPDTSVADVYRAQSHYLETYHRCQEGARKGVAEARKEYSAECEAIQQELSAAQKAAFTDYILGLNDGWTSVESHVLDAHQRRVTARGMASIAPFAISGAA